jgi:hypothetical protein
VSELPASLPADEHALSGVSGSAAAEQVGECPEWPDESIL